MLDLRCRFSSSKKRHERFSRYSLVADSLCFGNNIYSLFEKIGIEYDPRKWRLFIDRSFRSLKCVRLHSGNQHPLILIGHSLRMIVDYENVKIKKSDRKTTKTKNLHRAADCISYSTYLRMGTEGSQQKDGD